jgi:hypothetical protein
MTEASTTIDRPAVAGGAEPRQPSAGVSGDVQVPRERAVFASPDGRRGRRLRLAGRVVAALIVVWLAALLAGALGFGRLPGVPDLGSASGAPHRALSSRGAPVRVTGSRSPASKASTALAQGSSTSAAQGRERGVSRTPSTSAGSHAGAPASTGAGTSSGGSGSQSGSGSGSGSSKPSKAVLPGRRVGQSDATSSPGRGVGNIDKPVPKAPKPTPPGRAKVPLE